MNVHLRERERERVINSIKTTVGSNKAINYQLVKNLQEKLLIMGRRIGRKGVGGGYCWKSRNQAYNILWGFSSSVVQLLLYEDVNN